MDLYTLLDKARRDGHFRTLARNPLAQFGPNNRRYLGATLLPERLVRENAFREIAIRYRTLVANDGGRYSPAQKVGGGQIVGSFLVELGNQDVAQEFGSRDYDALMDLLEADQDMQAMTNVLDWFDIAIIQALISRIEIQRWQAIVNGQVVRVGDNGYRELVNYPNPAGHRVTLASAWSNPANDPFLDILSRAQFLWDKGYEIGRVITSRRVVSIMSGNPNVARRTGSLQVVNGSLVAANDFATLANINARLEADGLPPIETYDLRYDTPSGGNGRFFPDNVMVLACVTGRDAKVETPDQPLLIENTLGYVGLGRATGQAEPGRASSVKAHDDKPPRIDAEGWQMSLPVITDPEAFAVMTGIS